MPIAGTRWTPRNVAKLLYDSGWVNVDSLLKMACTVFAESGAYEWAWHWNSPADGGDGSTDWGFFQLNDGNKGGVAPKVDVHGKPIPVDKVKAFANEALDPHKAVVHARAMYVARGFKPWYGYRQPNGNEPWRKHITVCSLAICNMLREEYGVPLL